MLSKNIETIPRRVNTVDPRGGQALAESPIPGGGVVEEQKKVYCQE
jgi:hypothetical protein